MSKSTAPSLGQNIPAILTIAVAMLLVMLDATVINVAVPTLQTVFKTTLPTIQWAISGYTLALAAVTPLAGWLADRWGAKRIFIGAIIWFTLCSVACSWVPTIRWLIVLRVLQGLAGGLIGPIGMALSWQIIPSEKRGALMGLLGLPLVMAPILGPILSGWLLAHATWHAIFFINLPVGGIAALLVAYYLPHTSRQPQARLDVGGAFLSPFAFTTLIYGVHRLGNTAVTNPITLACLLLGTVALLGFIILELRQTEPLMALTAFKSGRFTRGIIVSWLNQIVLFGTTLLVPLFLQTAKGLSALHAGEMMAPQAMAAFIGMILGGRLLDRWGVRAAAIPGVTCMFGAIFTLTQLTAHTTTMALLGSITLLGFGQGLTMMQISTYNMSMAPRAVTSRLTPLINGAMQIVNSLAVVLLTNALATNLRHPLTGALSSPLTHTISAYATTFRLPLALLLVSWLLVWTLTRQPAKATSPSQPTTD